MSTSIISIENNIDIFNQRSIEQLPAHWAHFASIAGEYIQKNKSDSTRMAYKRDFNKFASWCNENGAASMPASSNVVTMYLAIQAEAGLALSTLERYRASIKYAHEMAGHISPTDAPSVKAIMGGISNESAPVHQKRPILDTDLLEMLKHCPLDTVQGIRDRALLTLGFSGAFRRSELGGARCVMIEDIQQVPEGLVIILPKSKTGKRIIPILNGKRIKAADAVNEWLRVSEITEGPILRRVSKGKFPTIGKSLSDKSVSDIVKKYCIKCGLDPSEFGAHSLRAGFMTSAAKNKANMFKMMDISGHVSVEMVRVYVRMWEMFENHAGESFL